MGKASTSGPEKELSSLDKWIADTDNITQNLSDLKDEIKKSKKTESMKELNLTEEKFDTDFDNAFSYFVSTMEDHCEQTFDKYAATHTKELQAIIDDDNDVTRKQKLDALSLDFQTYVFADTDVHAEKLKNLATDKFKIEINDLRSEVATENLKKEITKNETKETTTKEKAENFINTTDLKYTKIQSYTYIDFTKQTDADGNVVDKNGNQIISNKELKNFGLVNRYRNNNSDKNTAIMGILNEDMKGTFEKSDIRGINRDDLTEIMDELLDPVAYDDAHLRGGPDEIPVSLMDMIKDSRDDSGKLDKKLFKKTFKSEFKEHFIKTDKYKSKGIFRDTEKIVDLIVTAVEDQDNPEFRDALERLADVGDAYKNLDYTESYNADKLLEIIDPNDVFYFLCDFDSDGVVNSTPIDKKDINKKRRDTGSVMGGQLFTNFLEYADTKREDVENGEDRDGDGKADKIIIDGTKTTDLISHILTAAARDTENENLKTAITKFITEQTTTGDNLITMAEFTEFMKNTTYTRSTGEEANLSAAADVRNFLKSTTDRLNEGKDLSRLFMDEKEIQKNLLVSADTFNDGLLDLYENVLNGDTKMSDDFYGEGNPALDDIGEYKLTDKTAEKVNESVNDRMKDAKNLQQDFDKDALEGVRNTCTYNTIKIINYITDLIYVKFGKDSGKLIADMFSGTELGIRYSFYKPDGTINEKEVKKALREFIDKRTVVSIGAGLGEKGHPVIGASVSREKLSEDLWDKTTTHISAGIDIVNLATMVAGMFPCTFDIGTWKARQINEANATRLTTKKPIPVNRIGVETGINANSIRDRGPYLWLWLERDFPAGIEQKARYYDKIMKTVLFWSIKDPVIEVYESKNEFINGNGSDKIGMRARIMKSEDQDVKDNQEFLLDMIDRMGKELERTWVFDLVKANENDEDMQKKIFMYMYMTFIDAFHENAIEQKSYEQLTGKVKLTRFGLKTSLANILMRTGIGASLGSVIPGRGTFIGAATGTVVGLFTFSTRKTSYTEEALWYDRDKKEIVKKKWTLNYENIESGEGAASYDKLIEQWDKALIASTLEKDLNPNEKNISVTIGENNKIEITSFPEGTNPLSGINAYYAKDALNNNELSFDGKKLVLGNTSIRVEKNIKNDKVETFLMIGEQDPDTRKTRSPRNMIGLSEPITTNTASDVKAIEKVDYFPELTKEQIQAFIEKDANLAPYKDKILPFFADDGSLSTELGADIIPASIQGQKMTKGTLRFKETPPPESKVSIVYFDTSIPADKFTIEYVTQKAVDKSKAETIGTDLYNVSNTITTPTLFKAAANLDIFSGTLDKTIAGFENLYITTLYTEFMVSTLDADKNDFIDELDYDNAFTILVKIFKKNDKYNNSTSTSNPELFKLKTLIESIDVSKNSYDKAFMVDKCKALFSYDYSYTEGKNVPRKRDGYMKLTWPDETTAYPFTHDYKADIKDKIETSNLHRELVDNLVGFTSFYRINKEEAKRYSMTALGGTNVLSNGTLSESMAEIKDETDLKSAKNRFTSNLEKNTTNKEIIIAKLNEQLKSQNIILKTSDLKNLFNWDGVSIDNWQKIVKLSLTYYFYLLGECANESIGATIDNIKVYEKISGDYVETTISGSTDAHKTKRLNLNIYKGTKNAEYDIIWTQKDLTLAAGITGLFKHRKAETTAWDSDQSSNPNDNVTPGEGSNQDDSGNGNFGNGWG